MGVRELKDRLSSYLRAAEKGERIIVTDRGRPVAELSPPKLDQVGEARRELIEQGLLTPGKGNRRVHYPALKPLMSPEDVASLLDDVRGDR